MYHGPYSDDLSIFTISKQIAPILAACKLLARVNFPFTFTSTPDLAYPGRNGENVINIYGQETFHKSRSPKAPVNAISWMWYDLVDL